MYTDEDLNQAVSEGIFTQTSVDNFRQHISQERNTSSTDEENFKLIGSFNDIFVVIACVLVIISSIWLLEDIKGIAYLSAAGISWGLAEYFVRRRKMAFPAIILLLSFVVGVFSGVLGFFEKTTQTALLSASTLTALAAYLHWLRFKVPITVAAGVAAISGILMSAIITYDEQILKNFLPILFICGVGTFLYAMYWDQKDLTRTTYNSDVAFWLHLLSAPMMIHPVFSKLGILDGNETLSVVLIVIGLYILISIISIAIDRRAFMVSALIYVIYAISSLIETFGGLAYSFALTGTFIGVILLLMSAFWQVLRKQLYRLLPSSIQQVVPPVSKA